MAQKVISSFVADYPPEDVGKEGAETVAFGYGAVQYELDVLPAVAKEIHGYLSELAGAARKAGGSRSSGAPKRSNARRGDLREIRDWAKAQGIELKDRGRIPTDVEKQYNEANGL